MSINCTLAVHPNSWVTHTFLPHFLRMLIHSQVQKLPLLPHLPWWSIMHWQWHTLLSSPSSGSFRQRMQVMTLPLSEWPLEFGPLPFMVGAPATWLYKS